MGKVKSVLARTGEGGLERSMPMYSTNMACSTNRPTHLSQNNCMPVFRGDATNIFLGMSGYKLQSRIFLLHKLIL